MSDYPNIISHKELKKLRSELAKAKEEIEWWKEKANGSLAMANEAMDQRDRYREALEKIATTCNCEIGGCHAVIAKRALAGEEK